MIDNRFPWLVRIEHASEDPVRRRKMARFANAVGRRTGVKMCYNERTGGLFCYYGDTPDHGPCEIPEKFELNGTDIDDTVRMLQYGHRSRVEKDKQEQAQERAEKSKVQNDRQQFIEDNRPGVIEKASFLERKRRGVGKVSVSV
jgi:hypothetical protein